VRNERRTPGSGRGDEKPAAARRCGARRLFYMIAIAIVCPEHTTSMRGVELCERWGWAPRCRRSGVGVKPPRAAVVKSDGGERRGKGGTRICQVRFRETSESEPLMRGRNGTDDVETGGGSNSGTSLGGVLKTGPDGIRLKGGVNLDQALTWNGRTCRPDAKGFGQVGGPRETRDTDTGHRGRTARSRVEGAVMALDRRGCGVQPWRTANR
jgi:hypothetical protein